MKKQVMLYFYRLNMGKINPLLKESYEINKNLDGEGLSISKMSSFCGHCNQRKTKYIFSGLNYV
jgi:hypothetical protein